MAPISVAQQVEGLEWAAWFKEPELQAPGLAGVEAAGELEAVE